MSSESPDLKRKASDIEVKPEKPSKRKTTTRSRQTLGDTFGLVSDTMLCLPQGSSAKIMQLVASTDAEMRDESLADDGNEPCPIDADEALIKVYTERVTEKQASVVELVKRVFTERGHDYASFMLLNNASIPGRVNIVKALKGFEDAAKKMDKISTRVAQAFEDAICENS